ncbi:MAG: alpha/beta hydrolase [Acidobacteriota bacterium]
MARLLAAALALLLSGPTPPASLSDAPSRFAILDGNRIHYKVVGSGARTLVFVHGWTCDMSVWRLQVPAFAPRARVILVDLPGHGRSDAPEISYTMDLFAKAIDAVLRDAGVSRATLIGHSMGTPVVREFYRQHPEKTEALVAVDGAFRALFTQEDAQKLLVPYRGPEYTHALERFADYMVPADQAALRDELKHVMTKTPQRVAINAFENMIDPANFREDPIRVPLLNVLATSSRWPADYADSVRKLCPAAEFHMMDGVGHFLMLQKPEEFNATLAGFLEKPRDESPLKNETLLPGV